MMMTTPTMMMMIRGYQLQSSLVGIDLRLQKHGEDAGEVVLTSL